MPIFRHSVTGAEAELTSDYVAAFAAGTWEQVADEGPNEARARELREALDNKVEVVLDDEDGNEVSVVSEADQAAYLEAERKALIAFNTATDDAPAVSTPTGKRGKAAAIPVVADHVVTHEGEAK